VLTVDALNLDRSHYVSSQYGWAETEYAVTCAHPADAWTWALLFVQGGQIQ
jgi:hypothetical protein